MLKKKIWANFQRIIELFTKKIVTMLSRGQKGTGSGSATLVMQCRNVALFLIREKRSFVAPSVFKTRCFRQ
jgi:hypothetical protein